MKGVDKVMAIDKNRLKKATESNLDIYEEPAGVENNKQKTKKLTKRDTHKVYSFWANKEQIEVWNCYIEASSEIEKKEDLGLKAITEYIENHKLSGQDEKVYELKLKQKGLDKSSYR